MIGLAIEHDEVTQMLLEAVRRLVTDKIAPMADRIDQDNLFPRHLWPLLGEQGLLGITIDPAYGGSGSGYFHHALVMELISAGSAAVGLSYGAHSNLCVNQLGLNATEAQKQRYLPKLCSGEQVGALAMSEVGAGSDVMNMQCIAKVADGGYVLNGTKMWITNGPDADVLIVYAQTQTESEQKKISAFIIEKDFAGFSTAQKLDKLGMRGSSTCELIFKDCFVPADNLLGELHGGAAVLMSGLDYERVVLAAGPVGIMQACLDLALPYVRERKQFGKPVGQFELMQGKLADMYTQYNSARCYLHAVAKACDAGNVSRKDAASVILYTAENATQMALQTIQCLGGNGYINEYPAGRLLRDAKLYEIGAGTSEIRRMLIGRELFNAD